MRQGTNGAAVATGATGPTGPAALLPSFASTTSLGTTTTTVYTATLGGTPGTNPSVTATVGASGTVLVIITGRIDPSGDQGFISFAVSGATTRAANDATALVREHGTSGDTGFVQASAVYAVNGLTAGSNTFTLQYRSNVSGSTQSFSNRNIVVIPY